MVMAKVAIVYWSGTGNTELMAKAVVEGVSSKGAEAALITAAEFSASDIGNYDAIAFGCPSMGDEVLEESEFEPMFESCKSQLSGKKIGLFGSYDWGDGQWMRDWVDNCKSAGAVLVGEGVICREAPDADAENACKDLGSALA